MSAQRSPTREIIYSGIAESATQTIVGLLKQTPDADPAPFVKIVVLSAIKAALAGDAPAQR